MNTLQNLSIATAAAALFVLEAMSATQAITLASASLGSTNSGGGFTVDADQFLGWRFQVESTLQVTAIGGDLKMGSGSIFGAIGALRNLNDLPQGEPFFSEKVLAATTFDSRDLSGEGRIPLSVTLTPGYYGLIYGSGLFGTTGSGALLYNNSDFPGSTYFACWNCTSGSGTWSNSQISHIRFVVDGYADTPVPEPSSGLCILAFGGLGTGYMLRGRGEQQIKKVQRLELTQINPVSENNDAWGNQRYSPAQRICMVRKQGSGVVGVGLVHKLEGKQITVGQNPPYKRGNRGRVG